jgi:hypothetical protein
LFERASRTLSRALVTSSVPRDEIDALVDAETKARDATAFSAPASNLWRASTDDQVNDGMKRPSPEVLEIARHFSELDDEDRGLITRLIHLD